jgi:hypothetical protein
MTTYNVAVRKATRKSGGKGEPTKSNAGICGYGNGSPLKAPKVQGWSKESQGK